MRGISPFHLEKHLSKTQHQLGERVELIGKRWDDIQEDVITLILFLREREWTKEHEKNID
jgi:hypothetical protein